MTFASRPNYLPCEGSQADAGQAQLVQSLIFGVIQDFTRPLAAVVAPGLVLCECSSVLTAQVYWGTLEAGTEA